jgi:hypothetical protein
MPHVPSSPLTKLCQSQRIADLGILDDKVYPVDGPACNTCSQTQVQTITQEAVLACIHNYGETANRPVMACHAALWQYPYNMLHDVLDKTTGHLMEMQHLLVNPKYKELWGKWCGARLRGSNSNAVNLILRLFLYHFLHTMSM